MPKISGLLNKYGRTKNANTDADKRRNPTSSKPSTLKSPSSNTSSASSLNKPDEESTSVPGSKEGSPSIRRQYSTNSILSPLKGLPNSFSDPTVGPVTKDYMQQANTPQNTKKVSNFSHVVSIGELKRDDNTYRKNNKTVATYNPEKYVVSVYKNIELLRADSITKNNPVKPPIEIPLNLPEGRKFKNYTYKYNFFITISRAPLETPINGVMAFSNNKDILINNMDKINAYGTALAEYNNNKDDDTAIFNLNTAKGSIQSISKDYITFIGYGEIDKMDTLLEDLTKKNITQKNFKKPDNYTKRNNNPKKAWQ